MSLSSYMNQMKSLNTEIKRLSETLRTLRKNKNEIEKKIETLLKNKNLSQVRCNNNIITISDKNKRERKTKEQKTKDTIEILSKYGIRNTQNLVKEILDAQQGEQKLTQKLDIK